MLNTPKKKWWTYPRNMWVNLFIPPMAAALTLLGYSVDQTKAEMQKMIDGARRKGFDQISGEKEDFENILNCYSILLVDELTRKAFPTWVSSDTARSYDVRLIALTTPDASITPKVTKIIPISLFAVMLSSKNSHPPISVRTGVNAPIAPVFDGPKLVTA